MQKEKIPENCYFNNYIGTRLYYRHYIYSPLLGSSQRDGVLTIRNVDESARGRYQCTITIAAGVSGTGFVDLQVSSSSTQSTNQADLHDILIHDLRTNKLTNWTQQIFGNVSLVSGPGASFLQNKKMFQSRARGKYQGVRASHAYSLGCWMTRDISNKKAFQ